MVTGLRYVSGLPGTVVFDKNPGKNLRVAVSLCLPIATSAEKACTSLFRLAVAKVRRTTVFQVKNLSEAVFMGSYGGLRKDLRTLLRSHLGVSLCSMGLSIEKDFTREPKSASLEV